MADVSGLIVTVVGLSLNVASTIYSFAQNVRAASDSIRGLSSELFALIGVLEHMKLQRQQAAPSELEASLESRGPSSAKQVLEETLVFLLELKKSLDPPQSRVKVAVQKMKWPLKETETNSHLQRLERVKTYFILSQVTEEIDRTQEVARQIASLSIRVEENRLEKQAENMAYTCAKILEWLAPVSPQLTRDKVHQYRVGGSGSWFINSKSFKSWVILNATSTFWLNGITGSGKTTLMTTAVEKVRRTMPGAKLAYFYCSIANAESLEETAILGSLLAQLYQSPEMIMQKLDSSYRANGGQPNGSTPVRRLDAERLTELIVERIRDIESAYLFIDGVNECVDPEIVLQSLRNIIQSCPDNAVHLFVSSIDEKGIGPCMEKFSDLRAAPLRYNHHDISLLIQASLQMNPRLRRYNSLLKSEIKEALTHGAHGMLRWVQCQLDTLSRLRTPGAVREALTKLPPTLDKTYESLLSRIGDDEDKVLAREILEILAFTFRPLRLAELCEFLQITPGLRVLDESKCLADPADILSICGSLLTYPKETGLVTLAHHSVRTYLMSDLQGKSEYFRLLPRKAHSNLATKCLTYLSFNAFAGGPCSSATGLQEYYQRFPLLEYAAQRWALHVGNLEPLDDSMWETLKDFLFSADKARGNFQAWVQLLIPNSNALQIARTPPLYYAASFGLTEVVQRLLDAGADIEAHGGRGGATPLNIASFRGHYDVAKLLLERGADPAAEDHYGLWSAIEWARYNGHISVVKLLTSPDNHTKDASPYHRVAARSELITRRQQLGDFGANNETLVRAAMSSSWDITTESRHLWWSLVALAESRSNNTTAEAILGFARQYMRLHNTEMAESSIRHIESMAGRGVSAYIEPDASDPPRTYNVLVGNRALLHAKGVQLPVDIDKPPGPTTAASMQHLRVFVAIDGVYAGLLYLTDEPGAADLSAWEAPLRKVDGMIDYEKLTEMQKLEQRERGAEGKSVPPSTTKEKGWDSRGIIQSHTADGHLHAGQQLTRTVDNTIKRCF